MSQFVFQTTHRIYYNTEEAVPLGDIALALMALERIVTASEGAFEGVTGVDIDRMQVLISKLESGSLIEDIVIKFFFKDQAGLDAFIAKARSKTLENGVTGKSLVVGAVIAAAVGAGAFYAASRAGTGGQTTITANNNVIINIGAGEVGMTPEAFKAVVKPRSRTRRRWRKMPCSSLSRRALTARRRLPLMTTTRCVFLPRRSPRPPRLSSRKSWITPRITATSIYRFGQRTSIAASAAGLA